MPAAKVLRTLQAHETVPILHEKDNTPLYSFFLTQLIRNNEFSNFLFLHNCLFLRNTTIESESFTRVAIMSDI